MANLFGGGDGNNLTGNYKNTKPFVNLSFSLLFLCALCALCG
jgi:hypothetical protein